MAWLDKGLGAIAFTTGRIAAAMCASAGTVALTACPFAVALAGATMLTLVILFVTLLVTLLLFVMLFEFTFL